MKATDLLKKMRPTQAISSKRLPKRFHWQHHGEEFSARGHVVTQLEVRTHHRLEAQSAAERYSR